MKFGALTLSLLCVSFESHVTSAQRSGVLKRKKPEYLRNNAGADTKNAETANGGRQLYWSWNRPTPLRETPETRESVMIGTPSPPEDSSLTVDTSMSYETDHVILIPQDMGDDYVEQSMSVETSMHLEDDYVEEQSMSVETAMNLEDDYVEEQSMSVETIMHFEDDYVEEQSMSVETTEPENVDRAGPPQNPSTFYTSIFSNGQQTRSATMPAAKAATVAKPAAETVAAVKPAAKGPKGAKSEPAKKGAKGAKPAAKHAKGGKPAVAKGAKGAKGSKGRKMTQVEPTETSLDIEYVRKYLGGSAADTMEEEHRTLFFRRSPQSMELELSMEYSMSYSMSYSMAMEPQRNDNLELPFPLPDNKGVSKMPRPIASHPGKTSTGKSPVMNNRRRRMSREDWTRLVYDDSEPGVAVNVPSSMSYSVEDSISHSMSYSYGDYTSYSMSYDYSYYSYSMSYEYGSLDNENMSYDYSLSMDISFGSLADDGLDWGDDGDVQGGATTGGASSGSNSGSGSGSGSGAGSNFGSGSGSSSNSGSGNGSSSNSGSGNGSGSTTGSGSGSGSGSGNGSGTGSSGGFTAVKAPKGSGKAVAKAPKPNRASAAKSPGIPGLARKNARRRAQARRRRAAEVTEPKDMPWTTSEEPSIFLLESVKDMYQDFGAHMTSADQSFASEIESQFQTNLCGKSKCGGKVNMFKCLSCSTNSWYSAISESGKGAVHGFVDRDNNVVSSSDEAAALTHTRLDIAVPISGQDGKLRHFAARLGASLETFRKTPMGKQMSIRFFVTKYRGDFADISISDVKGELSYLTKLEIDDIIIVDVLDSEFSRANARNNLHRNVCQERDCIVTMMDVDMFILPRFFYNAHEFVQAGNSAYFPIVWSEYNPETVELVDDFYALDGVKQSTYSTHHGTWRQYGFGMYAISGADASKFMLNESFKGWGGEDTDFYHQVSSGLSIVRMREHGLIHIFHSKECAAGSFVKTSMIQQCFGSKTSVEGSQLGLYLRNLRESDEATFSSIFGMNRYEEDIVVLVVTSRENLSSRVAAIRESWGQTSNIPVNVHVRYFVGNGTESKLDLLPLAGLQDAEDLVVMTEVEDNEYPPVKKNTNMLKRAQEVILAMEASGDMDIKYVMKVDDDTYVNFDGLLKFLADRDPTEPHQFWGERGFGYVHDREGLRKAGMNKPFCTGGPGYVLSRETFDDTVQGIDDCVHGANISPYREYIWHSDVVIGMCVTRQTGIGCHDSADYKQNRVFLNNYGGPENFIKDRDLKNVVTMHPFKKEGQMERQHGRFELPVKKAMK